MVFQCLNCGKIEDASIGDRDVDAPMCCGKFMELMPDTRENIR